MSYYILAREDGDLPANEALAVTLMEVTGTCCSLGGLYLAACPWLGWFCLSVKPCRSPWNAMKHTPASMAVAQTTERCLTALTLCVCVSTPPDLGQGSVCLNSRDSTVCTCKVIMTWQQGPTMERGRLHFFVHFYKHFPSLFTPAQQLDLGFKMDLRWTTPQSWWTKVTLGTTKFLYYFSALQECVNALSV